MIRILCISDTHSYFDPALKEALKAADHIFHTGDIGDLSIINELENFTKTHVVSGNIDGFTRSGYPIFYRTEIQNHRFLLTHVGIVENKIYHRVETEINKEPTDIVVFGHSHQPFCKEINKIKFFNPGSAGPKREELPRTYGTIDIFEDDLSFELYYLPDQENPKE